MMIHCHHELAHYALYFVDDVSMNLLIWTYDHSDLEMLPRCSALSPGAETGSIAAMVDVGSGYGEKMANK